MYTFAAGPLTQQLFGKLFDRLDVNSDQNLTLKELKKADPAVSDADYAKAFDQLDADKNGKISRAEMTGGKAPLADAALGVTIAEQARGSKAEADARRATVAELFARNDVNRDGLLSEEEWETYGAMRRAAVLDTGLVSGPVFAAIPANPFSKNPHKEGFYRPDEIEAMGSLGFNFPSSAFKSFDEFSPQEQRTLLDLQGASKEAHGKHPIWTPVALSDEQKQQVRNQWLADAAEQDSAPAGTYKIRDRDIGAVRDQAKADFKAMTVSPSLSSRLMAQIFAELAAQGR